MERNEYLCHYGVKGMRWGVRRTKAQLDRAAGRRSSSDDAKRTRNREIAKKVAIGAGTALTVATAATIYATNKSAVDAIVSQVGKTAISGLKSAGMKSVEIGKAYAREVCSGVKEGVKEGHVGLKAAIKEGIKEGVTSGSKTAAKSVATGVVLNATKRALDASVGKEEAARILQANSSKKISSFWKVSQEDRDDDED